MRGVRFRAIPRLVVITLIFASVLGAAAYFSSGSRRQYLTDADLTREVNLPIQMSPTRLGDLEIQTPNNWPTLESDERFSGFVQVKRLADPVRLGREMLIGALPLEPPQSGRRAIAVAMRLLVEREELRSREIHYNTTQQLGLWHLEQIILTTRRREDLYQHAITVFSEDAKQWWVVAVTGPVTRVGYSVDQVLIDFKLLELMASSAVNHQMRDAEPQDFRAAGFVGATEPVRLPPYIRSRVYVNKPDGQPICLIDTKSRKLSIAHVRSVPRLDGVDSDRLTPYELMLSYYRQVMDEKPDEQLAWSETVDVRDIDHQMVNMERVGLTLMGGKTSSGTYDYSLIRRLVHVTSPDAASSMLFESIDEPVSFESDDDSWTDTVLATLAQLLSKGDEPALSIADALAQGKELADTVARDSAAGLESGIEYFDLQLGTQPWGTQIETVSRAEDGGLSGRTLILVELQDRTVRVERRWTADYAADKFEVASQSGVLGEEEKSSYRLSLADRQLTLLREKGEPWLAAAPEAFVWPMSEECWPAEQLGQLEGRTVIIWIGGSSQPPHPYWVRVERADSGLNLGHWRIGIRPMMAMDNEWLWMDQAGCLLTYEGVSISLRHTGSVTLISRKTSKQKILQAYPQWKQQVEGWLNEHETTNP